MAGANLDESRETVPEGYVAVPVLPDQEGSPLRVCLLAREEPGPEEGALVVLRESFGSRVLLGCVVDGGGVVREWVELCIQDVSGLAEGLAGQQADALSNRVLDRRFGTAFQAARRAGAASVIETGFETEHPPPAFLDLTNPRIFSPSAGGEENAWVLCEDDQVLEGAGLPAYSGSMHRYLYLPQQEDEEGDFVPVTSGAPENGRTLDLAQILPQDPAQAVRVNPSGGLMMVRRHRPLTYETYVNLLSGADPESVSRPAGNDLTCRLHPLADADGPGAMRSGRLFLDRHGPAARLRETLHLKLLLVCEAARAAREMTRTLGRPLLNLAAESFRVDLPVRGYGLPVFWTAKPELMDPGDAVSIRVRGSDREYFVRSADAAASIYRPAVSQNVVSGRGMLRIREVSVGEKVSLEGTFATQQIGQVSENDLLWLRLNVQDERVDLYGHPRAHEALARGEVRFRTVEQEMDEATATALKQKEGVPQSDVFFELLPVLSTPCDLYALGVLTVQTLLVDEDNSLPIALDEVFALAHEAASRHEEDSPLIGRIGAIFEEETRWEQAIGAHRLVRGSIPDETVEAAVPPEIWHRVLAAVVRMFPGTGPDSICRDYGDAPADGLHRVFNPVVEQWEELACTTRSLIINDQESNREVTGVIHSVLEKLE